MSEDLLQVKEKINIQSKTSKYKEAKVKIGVKFKKEPNHPYDKNKFSKNKRYKLPKKLNVFFIILVNFIIALIPINQISSDMAISLTTSIFNINKDYPIINIKNIGKPFEIIVNNNTIENMQNFGYKYTDDYLYVNSTNNRNPLEIKLIWKTDTSKTIPTINDTTIEIILDTFNTDEKTNIYDITSYTEILFENDSSEEKPEEDEEIKPSYFIIPDNFTLNAENMFNSCSIIQYIDFFEFDTSIITNMTHMFDGCSNLIEVKNLYPINTRDMSYLFYNCGSLKNFNLNLSEDTNITQVTNMERMFYYCNNLISVDLTNIYTNNVTSMRSMFYNC